MMSLKIKKIRNEEMKNLEKRKIICLIILIIITVSCVSHQFIPSVDYQNQTSTNIKLPFDADVNVQLSNSYNFRDRKPSAMTYAINSKGGEESELKNLLISEFKEMFDSNSNSKISINIKIKELSVYYPGYFTTVFGWYMLTAVPFTWLGIPAGPVRFVANVEVELLDKTFKSIRKVSKSGSLYYNNVHSNSFWKKQKNISFSQNALIKVITDLKTQISNEFPNLIAKKYNKSLLSSNEVLIKQIELFVNQEILNWENKGDYEKIEDYKKRVTSVNRNKQIDLITSNKINEFANSNISLQINYVDYCPDNEVFKIEMLGMKALYLNVPISNNEASNFEKNISKLQFEKPKFILTNEGVELASLTFNNILNGKKYKYDYKNQLGFKQNIIKMEFTPVKISTQDFPTSFGDDHDLVMIREEINIDINIPQTKIERKDAIAIVIGNKDYERTSNVDFAINDAKSVKAYLTQSFGFRPGNIIFIENASKGDFEGMFGTRDFAKARLFNMIKPNVSEVFIFYSGHGAPGLNNNKGYIVPVECDPSYLEIGGYSLETLYNNLTKLPAKNVTVVMDACFSGVGVHQNISAILPKIKNPAFSLPNGVLLGSSESTQVSSWYAEQKHGLFTYFFLRAIKDVQNSDSNKDGQLTYSELYKYIASQTEGIPYYSRSINGKEQNPVVKGNTDRIIFKYK